MTPAEAGKLTHPKDHPSDIHIKPDNGRAHLNSGACWCRPVVELESANGTIKLWVHWDEVAF